jgi:hypothetical protein
LKLVNWVGAALAIVGALRKEDVRISPKHIVVKPRKLSDHNLLRGVSGLRAILYFIPPAAIAAPVLGLGQMGFKIWKRFALDEEYDRIEFPPMDPNMLRLSIELDPELRKHYGTLVKEHNWNAEVLTELEMVYNDFQFLTDFNMLRAKYPHADEEYVRNKALINKHNMQENLDAIEQELLRVSHTPEISHNIREAFENLRELFPVMQDWALFNSDGFNDVVEVLDTLF